MDKKTICNDLDSIKKKGFRAVIFEAGYKLPFKYLSEEWFKAIRTGVLEAKKRGMKVWIIDEGKYPSGFAGGILHANLNIILLNNRRGQELVDIPWNDELHNFYIFRLASMWYDGLLPEDWLCRYVFHRAMR